MTRYDVAIVGAGPSGSWAARKLAARGATVLLADPSHPREKPCGGGITGRALALVSAALGTERPPVVAIRQARFVDTGSGQSVAAPLDPSHPDLVIASRSWFDARLLESAREVVAAFHAARLVEITGDGHGFTLRMSNGETVVADRVIAADGANSFTRRRLTTPFRREQISIATGYFAHGVTSDEVVIEFVSDPPGYIWSFPRTDHLAIGICAPSDAGTTAEALRTRTADWIQVSGIGTGAARLQPYSWPIPSLSERDLTNLAVAGSRWLLVGDAAGLVDPITREGIFFALKSAELAADAITSASSDPERVYQQQVREEIVSELMLAAQLKARFFQPRFTHLLLDALGQSPRITRIMADLVAGTQGYRGLRRRLLATAEFRLAWQLIRAGWFAKAQGPK